MVSYGFPMISYGFLWFPMASLWLSRGFAWFPMGVSRKRLGRGNAVDPNFWDVKRVLKDVFLLFKKVKLKLNIGGRTSGTAKNAVQTVFT